MGNIYLLLINILGFPEIEIIRIIEEDGNTKTRVVHLGPTELTRRDDHRYVSKAFNSQQKEKLDGKRVSNPRSRLKNYNWVAPLWLVFILHVSHCLIDLIYIYLYIHKVITDEDKSRNV